MFVHGQDFVCDDTNGILRCVPKSLTAISACKVLQMQLVKLAAQLPEPPPVAIDVNGTIGPTTALTLQMIASRLCLGAHQELAELAGAQPEQSIPYITTHALELAGYFDRLTESDPTALLTPQPMQGPVFDPIAVFKSIFTVKRVVAGTATLLGLGAIALIANAADKRTGGLIDRSGWLPPSDGSDDFEEEIEDEVEDDSEDEIDRAGAIDAESVEVESHAAA